MNNIPLLKKYAYLWATLALFIFSIAGHWTAGWFAYIDEQIAHKQPVDVQQFFTLTLRDTFENWQSEFLQLIWQVAGLAYLWYLGSPQSKESDDRKEEKLDEILKTLNKKNGAKIIASLDKKYPRK